MEPVPTALPERPGPPPELNEEGRARWREVVNELPVDRLRHSDFNLLLNLILAEQYVAECDRVIAEHGLILGPKPYTNPAVRIREYNLRTIVQIQRALRLCPSMRMRQDAGGLNGKPKPQKKPWER
jgi:P27 family predicted phage terminase small subunit